MVGLRGWLGVLGVWVCLGLVGALTGVLVCVSGHAGWLPQELVTLGAVGKPLTGTGAGLELAHQLVELIFSMYLTRLFFQRRRSFPVCFVLWTVIGAAALNFAVGVPALFSMKPLWGLQGGTGTQVFLLVYSACLLMISAYLLRSVRVRSTFIRVYGQGRAASDPAGEELAVLAPGPISAPG
jgi:hypothetical protein